MATDHHHGPNDLLGLSIRPHPEGGDWRLLDVQDQVLSHGSRAECEWTRLNHLLADYGAGQHNLPLRTLGGRQYWVDMVAHAGWRIQRNTFSDHYRLLDSSNRRRAWGSLAACRTALEQQRLKQGLAWPDEHVVILLHGILRSPRSLRAVERGLQAQGFATLSLSYASSREDVASAAAALHHLLSNLHGVTSIDVVTHSMGSLVVRQYLQDLPEDQHPVQLRRLALIFPPSQGSALAQRLHNWPLYRLVTGPAGQDLPPAAVADLHIPKQPTLIIAGNKGFGLGQFFGLDGEGDGTVLLDEAALGSAPIQVYPVGHSFGMNDPQVIDAVCDWLKKAP